MATRGGLVQLSSRSSLTVWCIVKRGEADLLPYTLAPLAQHPLVKHAVVVHTGAARPPSYGELQRYGPKFSEHHQFFGEGLDQSLADGGFDQVAARNFCLAIAESLGDRWLFQFDADDYYDPSLLDRIAKLPSPIRAVRCACFHLLDPQHYWHNEAKILVEDGTTLHNPHIRIWRNDRPRRFEICERTAAVEANVTRHCGVDLSDIDDATVTTFAEPLHLHLHHMLGKSGRSLEWLRRRLPPSVVLPPQLIDFARSRPTTDATPAIAPAGLISPLSLIPSGPETLVHFPLRGVAFRANDAATPILTKLRDGAALSATEQRSPVFTGLKRAGLIGHERDRLPVIRALRAFEPTEATLIFTESCNLGCSYCYASSTPSKRKAMPWPIAKAAVDLVVANASKRSGRSCSIRYIGGGEPTIEWALLKQTNDYARELSAQQGVQCDMRLITNGTLLTPERVDYIAANIDFVTLSFEILPELQLQRRFAGGKSSHRRLLRTVELLCERGVKFHFRTTITEKSVSRMVDMVWYAHLNTNATSIRFEPMAEIGRGARSGGKPAEEIFVEQFLAARRLGKTLGIDVRCKMISIVDEASARFCEAEFSVGVDGAVSACHRYSRPDHENYQLFKFGQFDGSGFSFDLDQLNRIRGVNVHTYRECDTCFARWSCAGGCLSARMTDGAPAETGPLCHLTRELFKASIIESMNASEDGHG
jgi:uncharacterized protein